jgi:hypothetical protein
VAAAHGNAERCRRGRRRAAVEFGSGARELAKEPEEWDVEALVVLVRARDRGLGLRCRLSTATVRWRPSKAPAAVARANKDNREGNRAGLEERMTRGRGRSRRSTTAICTAAAGGGAAPAAEQKSKGAEDRGGSEEEEERKGSGGLVCENRKLQGPHRKEGFPTDLEIF